MRIKYFFRTLISPVFLIPLALLSFWGCFLRHAAPAVTAGDSGEFITAAVTLSIPHPPSYPLYSLAGKAFHVLLPWGGSGYRLNVFSAAAHAVSLSLIFWIGRRLNFSRGAALFAAALAGSTPAFFHNSLITEVFALNTLLALAVWAAGLFGGRGSLPLSGFLTGLGLGNHHTLSLIFPGWLAGWRGESGREGGARSGKRWAAGILLFLAGFGVYAVLPLRSHQSPPVDWGNPETPGGLFRTVARKDYGTLRLSLGETPPRTASNTLRQFGRFLKHYSAEMTPVGALLVLAGLVVLLRDRFFLGLSLLLVWFFTGPFFILIGNPAFDAQSEGVLERFIVLPVVFSVFAAARVWDGFARRIGRASFVLFALPLFLLHRSGEAYPLRTDFLVHDYSRAVLRTLPPGAAFFMDGGDDTFFSMAFQRFVLMKRPDLSVFDRGGLIFGNPYGPDFRSLPPAQKEERRVAVEKSWAARRPLFYSTMNEKILPGMRLRLNGFLYHAVEPPADGPGPGMWNFYAIRALYPTLSDDYRTRALAPYFPFMRARSLREAGRYEDALAYLRRAWLTAPDVPWVRSNVVIQNLDFAFDRMQAGEWDLAEAFYRFCLEIEPDRVDALTNMGVLFERKGELARSAEWYERALRVDPANVNALFNRAVLHWRAAEWKEVIRILQRVLELNPSHPGALRYLPAARERAAAS